MLFASLGAARCCYWQWRPIPTVIWTVEDPLGVRRCTRVFWLGWAVLLVGTFLINHFELFGLRQVYRAAARPSAAAAGFRTPFLYRLRAAPDLSRLPARLLGDAAR